MKQILHVHPITLASGGKDSIKIWQYSHIRMGKELEEEEG
jgi:hypothetical protein